MALVTNLSITDNKLPKSATADITARRIGNSLKDRFENFIHKDECNSQQKDYDIKMSSRALAAFSIFYLAKTDDETAGKSVCDRSDDGGIDAIYVNTSEKVVVIVQSKFNQSGGNTWSKNEFLNFKNACEKLQNEEYNSFNDLLNKQAKDITKALNSIDYKFLFVMTHTGKKGAAEEILSEMQKWQNELNDAALVTENTPDALLPFQVHLVSAEDLMDWIKAKVTNTVDLKEVKLTQYGRLDSPYTAIYGVLSGDQIYEWYEEHANQLFSMNIRNLLGKTDVNESIQETAEKEPHHFWYFNNGITVLTSSVEAHRRNNNNDTSQGLFSFKNVSIINGAQTVSSIGKLLKEDPTIDIKDLKVHVRFICIDSENSDQLSKEITRSNNHQNRVLGRDFASQEENQLRLRDELILEGFTYQLLRSDNDLPKDPKVIDIDEALDALACLSKTASNVATLKNKRGKFFENLESSYYKSLFNPRLSGIQLINAVLHNREIDIAIKNELIEVDRNTDRKKYAILTHGNRVFSSIILNSINNISNPTKVLSPNHEDLKAKLISILNSSEEYITENYNSAYLARFFSNTAKINTFYENIQI